MSSALSRTKRIISATDYASKRDPLWRERGLDHQFARPAGQRYLAASHLSSASKLWNRAHGATPLL